MTYQQVGEEDRHEDQEDGPEDVHVEDRGKLQLRSGFIQWVGGLAEDGIVLKPVVMVMVFTRAQAGVENGVRCRGQSKGRYHGYN